MTKILFAINPIAGDIDKEVMEEDVQVFCERNGLDTLSYKTTGNNDELQLASAIDTYKPDVVVALGGDGTVSLAAKLLLDTAIPLAIIPLGSGNGLSKDLDIPQGFFDALHVLSNYQTKAIDTLSVNGQACIHLCDLGFNALVVKNFNDGETRGPGSYAWIALQEFMAYEPKTYTVQVNGHILFSGEAFMVVVTNAKAFGSNATINPHGIIDDGLFEIFILEPFPKASSLNLLYQMYTDAIDDSDFTKRFSCREATIINHANEPVHIDGEPVDMPPQIHFKVQPQSLQVVLPAQEPEF